MRITGLPTPLHVAADDATACVHLHDAGAGCLAARVDRDGAAR